MEMDLDGSRDDSPPLLVTVDDQPAQVPDQLDVAFENLNFIKVPITIVTGRLQVQISSSWIPLLALLVS
jgi:hypothetical protein